MTIQCCKCKRVRLDNAWRRPSGALSGAITHSYCPVCLTEAQVEIFSARASEITCSAAVTLGNFVKNIPHKA